MVGDEKKKESYLSYWAQEIHQIKCCNCATCNGCSSSMMTRGCPSPAWFVYISQSPSGSLQPVAPPASSHRASPLWSARPAFQSCDSNLFQLSKMRSENRGVCCYLTGENNYNWHLSARQAAGNLTPATVLLQVRTVVLKWFLPAQQWRVYRALPAVTDRQLVWKDWLTLNSLYHGIHAAVQFQILLLTYLPLDCEGIGVRVASPTPGHSEILFVV